MKAHYTTFHYELILGKHRIVQTDSYPSSADFSFNPRSISRSLGHTEQEHYSMQHLTAVPDARGSMNEILWMGAPSALLKGMLI